VESLDIDWHSCRSHLLMNPRYSQEEKKRFHALLDSASDYSGHIWLSTSGSQAAKWVGVSKEAVLISAHSVNQFLQSTKQDVWIQALPSFHVGGMGIWVRSFLSGASVFDFRQEHAGKWSAENFYEFVVEKKGTLTALVPTQLYDLILQRRPCPSSLRAIIIGGGSLSRTLYNEAIEAGWPILPSYGMTECSSQIATGGLDQNTLKILPHVEVKIERGLICLKSRSLLTTYAFDTPEGWRFIDPKAGGWYTSADRGELYNGYLQPQGRTDHIIKIGGESVDLDKLEALLQELKENFNILGDITLVDMDVPRLGKAIHLVSTSSSSEDLKPLIDHFDNTVMSYERIHQVHIIPEIPRSPMMKILKEPLRRMILRDKAKKNI
jgi:o-succinylbenzoate---CoA ligase